MDAQDIYYREKLSELQKNKQKKEDKKALAILSILLLIALVYFVLFYAAIFLLSPGIYLTINWSLYASRIGSKTELWSISILICGTLYLTLFLANIKNIKAVWLSICIFFSILGLLTPTNTNQAKSTLDYASKYFDPIGKHQIPTSHITDQSKLTPIPNTNTTSTTNNALPTFKNSSNRTLPEDKNLTHSSDHSNDDNGLKVDSTPAEKFQTKNNSELYSSPSFDCNKASNKVENLICNNADLSELDRELSMHYINSIRNTENPKELKIKQIEWIKTVQIECNDDLCLISAYKERIDFFKNQIYQK